MILSTNDAGVTGYLHAKELKWTPISHHIQTLTQMVYRPKVRTRINTLRGKHRHKSSSS